MVNRPIALLLLTLSVTVLAHAPVAAQDRFPVSVEVTSDDPVGRAFAFEVREAIRASKGYTLVAVESQASVFVYLVTLDVNQNSRLANASAAISYVVAFKSDSIRPYFLTSGIKFIGSDTVAEGAHLFVGQLDNAVAEMLKDIEAYVKRTVAK